MSHAPDHPRLSGYAVCVQDRGGYNHVLLARLTGLAYWTLPGGGVDFGEHPQDAAVREVREETGLEIELGPPLGIDSIVGPNSEGVPQHSVRVVYRGTVIDGVLKSEAHGSTDQAAWIRVDDLDALPLVDLASTALAWAGLLPAQQDE